MEIAVKIKASEVVDLVIQHLETQGLFVGPDAADVFLTVLVDSGIFPAAIDAELRQVVRNQPLLTHPGITTKTPSVVEEEHPPKPAPAKALGHTELMDPNTDTRGLVQDEGPPIADQMAALLRNNDEMLAAGAPKYRS